MNRAGFSIQRVFVQCVLWSCCIAILVAVHVVNRRGLVEGHQKLFVLQAVQAQANAKPAMAMPAAAPSSSLTVTIDGKAKRFSAAELKAMPQKTVKVHNEHSNVDETYSGVELADVLAKCGFVVGKTEHHQIIRSYLKVEGTDKYWVLYSALEVEPSEHNGDVIVATSLNGGAIGADGELKLVSTEDKKAQRWVRNLTAITMKTAE
jgi:hypothetical protein